MAPCPANSSSLSLARVRGIEGPEPCRHGKLWEGLSRVGGESRVGGGRGLERGATADEDFEREESHLAEAPGATWDSIPTKTPIAWINGPLSDVYRPPSTTVRSVREWIE
jgi:hypothetical protein